MPSALLARRLGCRNLLSLCNLITVGCLLAMPAAAGSVRTLSLITTLQGFVGAAMLPVCAMMKTHWLPATLPAAERSFALRVTAWGMFVGRLLTSSLTPFIAGFAGWRAVPRVFGAALALATVPFQLIVSDSPATWRSKAFPLSDFERQVFLSPKPEPEPEPEPALEPEMEPGPSRRTLGATVRLLCSRRAVAAVTLHTADNLTSYCLVYWAPTYFMDVLKLSPQATGVYLGSTQVISMAGCIIAPMAEIALLKLGLGPTAVRRAVGGSGAALQAACVSGFVLLGPLPAALLYGLSESSNGRPSHLNLPRDRLTETVLANRQPVQGVHAGRRIHDQLSRGGWQSERRWAHLLLRPDPRQHPRAPLPSPPSAKCVRVQTG